MTPERSLDLVTDWSIKTIHYTLLAVHGTPPEDNEALQQEIAVTIDRIHDEIYDRVYGNRPAHAAISLRDILEGVLRWATEYVNQPYDGKWA
jgi:hypothetical protein